MTDSPRVVLFGASGYTGTLTAVAMAEAGLRPVLAGRSRERLEEVVGAVLRKGRIAGGIEIADVDEPASVAALVGKGDVIVSTVGPFTRWGDPAVEAAIGGRAAAYIDSTGEPPFIRRIFDEWGPRAEAAGVPLLTAFGYDYVPGNLAGALAVRDAAEAGTPPARVDVGYFIRTRDGGGAPGLSGGTAASAAAMMLEPSIAWSRGALREERGGKRTRSFDIRDKRYDGLTVGGSEHLALPRLSSSISDVNVYLGWAGPRTNLVSKGGAVLGTALKVPGAKSGLGAVLSRTVKGSSGGPDEQQRAGSRTLAVAECFDPVGRLLSRAVVDGPSPYDLTASLLAWAARTALDGRIQRTGALGPADVVGLDGLVEACAGIGLVRVE
jgi:short subunit dehydrogenase-like uncharacterized protein